MPKMERLVLTGGFDLDFIDPPPDDLLCLICLLLSKDPIQVGQHWPKVQGSSVSPPQSWEQLAIVSGRCTNW